MQKQLFITLIAGLFIVASCKKAELKDPSFDISTEKTTYKKGDTILFRFSGNPDFISFFSGEAGKKYENVNRVNAKGSPKLQFTSVRANGTQTGSLFIMVSNDFAGTGASEAITTANIAKATWTDITSRATLSTGSSIASGAIDLSDFLTAAKPVYIAFKYLAASGSIQNKWTISGLSVTNVLPDATYTLANLTATAITNYSISTLVSPGWLGYKVSNTYNWVVTSGSSLVITGATTAGAATAPAEAWVLTGPLDLTKVTPDIGTFVKGIDIRRENYSNVYLTPGTYNASFVARSSKLNDIKDVVRTVQLTITP